MTDPVKKGISRKAIGAVASGLGVVLVFVLMFSPMITVSYQEQYVDIETRQEPYQVRQTKTDTLGSLDDYTLLPGAMKYWSARLSEGVRVQYSYSSSPSMDFYVVSQSGFASDRNTIRENAIVMTEDKTTGQNGFNTIFAGTYYFVVHNPHAGFWSIDRDVAIYSAQSTATWEEDVTKYRNVDVPVTKYRDATKNVSLIDSIMGKK